MKAKLGEKVWCIYDNQIILEQVEFIGANSFLIEDYASKYDPEIFYDDYGETWFRDLEKAKKKMRKIFGRSFKLEKWADCEIWEIVEED